MYHRCICPVVNILCLCRKMLRFNEELPFRLVGMNIEDLNREIENLSDNEIIEPIPSGSESETDISDREELTIDGNLNPEIVMSEDEADESESDIPL